MPDAKRPFGQRGEALAVEHLKGWGYLILARNWRCKHGEIDIIAQKGETVVFVEVRSRHSNTPETAFETITPRKRAKLTALAQLYLNQHEMDDREWRVDVIAIAFPRSGAPFIEQAEDALGW